MILLFHSTVGLHCTPNVGSVYIGPVSHNVLSYITNQCKSLLIASTCKLPALRHTYQQARTSWTLTVVQIELVHNENLSTTTQLFIPVILYAIYTKVRGHPFKWVDLAISATPVADRCIKLRTPPCNLHRQTLAVEWPYWRAQWLSMWHHHGMSPFQKVSSSNSCPARAAPVNCKCYYCEVETLRSNNGSAAKW